MSIGILNLSWTAGGKGLPDNSPAQWNSQYPCSKECHKQGDFLLHTGQDTQGRQNHSMVHTSNQYGTLSSMTSLNPASRKWWTALSAPAGPSPSTHVRVFPGTPKGSERGNWKLMGNCKRMQLPHPLVHSGYLRCALLTTFITTSNVMNLCNSGNVGRRCWMATFADQF